MSSQLLNDLIVLSNKYGSDPAMVLAGGGNTSAKTSDHLWVKPSGVPLATLTAADLVKMDRAELDAVLAAQYPAEPAAREDAVKSAMAAAVCPGSGGRPSVEAALHHLVEAPLVVHTHPALVNGMTCSSRGAETCARLFPDALWVPYTDPGYTLAATMQTLLAEYKAKHGQQPALVFIQNHGVFAAASSAAAIASLHDRVMSTLDAAYTQAKVSTALVSGTLDKAAVFTAAPVLRALLGDADRLVVVSAPPFAVAQGPLTPDHIVYAKSFAYAGAMEAEPIDAFARSKGYRPVIVSQPGAVFASGGTLGTARTAMALARDAALVAQLATAFGGPRYLDDRSRSFIEHWEVEQYRRGVQRAASRGRLAGRISVVTGAAQGFGKGIAEFLAAEGALVVVADLNRDGAETLAHDLDKRFGSGSAIAAAVDISDEASVQAMIHRVVLECGGIDLFVANAGVLKAGSVKTLSLADWEFVTRINYTGYFLCVKHASAVMAAQNVAGRGTWMDIVQVNSKSGLQGSNKNAAYAGSKFGTIGMTQSFAKELVEDRIKVNSICPGNYLEGPLWSDPDNGLFRQYLDTGKVPGARSIEDVKRHYERQVPMGRGCLPEDVGRAIVYCVEQQYETGQAIPVTGGQVMLA